jgi:hypothetical protein
MKGGKAKAARFNSSGVTGNIWKSNEAKIMSVGNMAAMPIQAKSRKEYAEEWAWLVPGVACPWSGGEV